MKIAVVGLWHLGMVTAACLAAEGHTVVAVDEPSTIEAIAGGRLPVDEPGLADLVDTEVATKRLSFAADAQAARGSELIWICYDTPVNADDTADPDFVVRKATEFLQTFAAEAVVAVSSQLPVGSIAKLERTFDGDPFRFVSIPENLRLGSAIAYFRSPDRFIVGTRDDGARAVVEAAIDGFAQNIVWMGVESAEMTKHALNAFLATSVAFANELAAVCERTGADAREVERGLKSDIRIGAKAYIRAGEAFSGGTLARDLAFLAALGDEKDLALPQTRATVTSNDRHRDWAYERIKEAAGESGPRVGILGLVYKPGTNTLRGSTAMALAQRLTREGFEVRAYDPVIAVNDDRLSGIAILTETAEGTIDGSDLLVVATGWPEFTKIEPGVFARNKSLVVIDVMRFLEAHLGGLQSLRYVAFGKGTRQGVQTG